MGCFVTAALYVKAGSPSTMLCGTGRETVDAGRGLVGQVVVVVGPWLGLKGGSVKVWCRAVIVN